MYRRLFAPFLAVLLLPTLLPAQPLSDKVPGDALVYVGWQGTDKLPAGYEKSHLKGLLESSNIPALFSELWPQVIQRVSQEDKDAADALSIAYAILGPMWRHPSALFVGPFDWQNAAEPTPHFGLICDAGADADNLLGTIRGILAKENAPPFVRAFKKDTLVALVVGYERDEDALGVGKPLAGNEKFKSAMGQVIKEPVAVVYADADGILNIVQQAGQANNDELIKKLWGNFREATGLSGLKQIIWTGGFDGPDWASQCFIAAPAPRTGLLSLMNQAPASDEILRSIPKTATWMAVGRLDLAKLVAEIRTGAGKLDPEAQKGVDMALGGAQMALAMNVQTDLLDPLGDEWAIYSDPSVAGKGLTGIALVNRLRNADMARRGLGKLELFIDNAINGQIRAQKVRVTFEQTTIDGLEIHYVNVPFVAPAWAIKDGSLYCGLYPQVVAAAAKAGGQGTSILENEKFVALRKRLGGEKASGIAYADLPRTVEDGYPLVLALSQSALGFADMMGIKIPPMVIPPLPKLREHLTPAFGVSWTDDAGWHARTVKPFPAAELVCSEPSVYAAAAVMMMGVSMPATYRARETAGRVQSMSNLKQIGMGIMLYANENRGNFPPDLGTLVLKEDLTTVNVFVEPSRQGLVPPHIRTATPQQKAKWVNENADYVYLGAGLSSTTEADVIVAHSRPELSNGQGINALYADGHVEWHPNGIYQGELEKSKQRRQELLQKRSL